MRGTQLNVLKQINSWAITKGISFLLINWRLCSEDLKLLLKDEHYSSGSILYGQMASYIYSYQKMAIDGWTISQHRDNKSASWKARKQYFVNGRKHDVERYNLEILYLQWQLLKQMEDASRIQKADFRNSCYTSTYVSWIN